MELKKYKLRMLCLPNGIGKYGIPAPAIEYSKYKIRYLRISDISDEGMLVNTDKKSVESDDIEQYILEENDIVFARTGNSTGRAYLYSKKDGVMAYAGFLIKYQLDEHKVNPVFLHYFTLSNYYKQWVKNLSVGSTRGNISAQTFADCPIVLPPRHQQDVLAEILSNIDSKIKLNRQINDNLEAMAKQLYDYWFVQFDFPNEEEKPYKSSGGAMVYNERLKREIPVGWNVVDISAIANVHRGQIITQAETSHGTIKVVAAGVTYSYLNGESNRPKNTITVSGSGANAGFINFWREPIFASDCTTVNCNTEIDTILCFYGLSLFQERLYSLAVGAAQPHVYPAHIASIPILDIPQILKDKVSEFFCKSNDEIANNLAEIENLTKQRNDLLPLLMNGQASI